MLDDTLLNILRCPTTRQRLRVATPEEKLHMKIAADVEALATVDGAKIYRVSEGLLVLLPSVNEVVSEG